MACTRCNSPDHEVSACPQPAPDPQALAIDRLGNAITAALERGIKAAAPPPTEAPPPAGDPLKDLKSRVKESINAGNADEAVEILYREAIGPQQAKTQALAIAQAESNRRTMREKYGVKFSKREELFNSIQRRHGVPEESLADMRIVQNIWDVVRSEDPTFNTEEAEARWEALQREKAEAAAKNPPPPLSPIIASVPVPDEYKKLASEHLSDNAEERSWELSQLAAYGIPLDAFLRQAAKTNDPESTQSIGVGKYRREVWTEIGGKSRPKPAARAATR